MGGGHAIPEPVRIGLGRFENSVGRAASPLAAGNRDVQGNVMGGADASRPEAATLFLEPPLPGGASSPSEPLQPFERLPRNARPTAFFRDFPDVSRPQGRAEARPSRDALLGEGRASARPLEQGKRGWGWCMEGSPARQMGNRIPTHEVARKRDPPRGALQGRDALPRVRFGRGGGRDPGDFSWTPTCRDHRQNQRVFLDIASGVRIHPGAGVDRQELPLPSRFPTTWSRGSATLVPGTLSPGRDALPRVRAGNGG